MKLKKEVKEGRLGFPQLQFLLSGPLNNNRLARGPLNNNRGPRNNNRLTRGPRNNKRLKRGPLNNNRLAGGPLNYNRLARGPRNNNQNNQNVTNQNLFSLYITPLCINCNYFNYVVAIASTRPEYLYYLFTYYEHIANKQYLNVVVGFSFP